MTRPKGASKGKGAPEVPRAVDAEIGPMGLPLVRLDSLQLDPMNAKEHNERNLTLIGDSVERFGQRRPIVVRATDKLVEAGNGLVMAMLARGHTYGEVLWVNDSEEEAAAFALVDNRAAELSSYNLENLVGRLEMAGDLEDEQEALREIAGIGPKGSKPGFAKLDGRKSDKNKPVAFYVMPDTVGPLQAAIEVAYGEGAGSTMEAIKLMAEAYIAGANRG